MRQRQEGGCHFHWLADESVYDEVQGSIGKRRTGWEKPKNAGNERKLRAASEAAFEESGCKADCEGDIPEVYRTAVYLSWKEIQARNGYILHDLHLDDIPVEMITTDSSPGGADAEKRSEAAGDHGKHLVLGKWNDRREYCFERKIPVVKSRAETIMKRTASNAEADTKEAAVKATASNAEKEKYF